MHQKNFLTLRLFLTGLLPLFVWTLLAWQHSHGGVASHHLLADAAMPAISNWWGGLLLPLLTGFLLYRIQKRVYGKPDGLPKAPQLLPGAFSGFIGALTFGILLSTFFTFGEEELCGYLILGLLPLALFYPLYRAEWFSPKLMVLPQVTCCSHSNSKALIICCLLGVTTNEYRTI